MLFFRGWIELLITMWENDYESCRKERIRLTKKKSVKCEFFSVFGLRVLKVVVGKYEVMNSTTCLSQEVCGFHH